jgi:hypothetical protein
METNEKKKKVILIIGKEPTLKLIAPDESILIHDAQIEWQLRHKEKKGHQRPYKYHK